MSREPREAALFRLNVLASYGPRFAGALTRSELYSLLEQGGFKGVDMVGLPDTDEHWSAPEHRKTKDTMGGRSV